MATRTINGLTWDIDTPSHWQLRGVNVDMSYVGMGQWVLMCPGKDGAPLFRYFATREQACELIEQAMRAA